VAKRHEKFSRSRSAKPGIASLRLRVGVGFDEVPRRRIDLVPIVPITWMGPALEDVRKRSLPRIYSVKIRQVVLLPKHPPWASADSRTSAYFVALDAELVQLNWFSCVFPVIPQRKGYLPDGFALHPQPGVVLLAP
jgi:hypothetical protein